MEIAISGAGGLMGSALVPLLEADGHRLRRMVRSRESVRPGEIYWSPTEGGVDGESLEGLDAVVHLAGENLAARRWTERQKRVLYDSRVAGTRAVAQALERLQRPPRVFVAASAIGYYGSRGNEKLNEGSEAGAGFLAELTRDWEAACEPAERAGIRVVRLRTGVVLGRGGGALRKMLLPFRLGLGGPIGDGCRWLSWIGRAETARVIRFAIDRRELSGPVNVVSPNPVTNAEFTRTLAAALRRPAFVPLPAALVSLLWGEMGRETVLSSARVLPRVLQEAGYDFLHPELEGALRHELRVGEAG